MAHEKKDDKQEPREWGPKDRADNPLLQTLKIKADALGIKYHHRIGINRLAELVSQHENELDEQDEEGTIEGEYGSYDGDASEEDVGEEGGIEADAPDEEGQEVKPESPPVVVPKNLCMTEQEYLEKTTAENKQNMGRLVRIRLQCLNPNKKQWPGEIISVGSARMGTFKKYIPYNSDEPYHVPYVIYKELLNRKCRVGYVVNGPNGQKINRSKLVNEYAIERMEPMTIQELKELARRQAMAGGVEE
jgi:hypothetical protein